MASLDAEAGTARAPLFRPSTHEQATSWSPCGGDGAAKHGGNDEPTADAAQHGLSQGVEPERRCGQHDGGDGGEER